MRTRSRLIIAAAGAVAAGVAFTGIVVGLEPRPQATTSAGAAALRSADIAPTKPTAAPEPPAPPADPAPPAPPPPPPPAGADPAEAQVLELTNAQRAANGCPPLSYDDGLASVARSHSADMAARDYFSHDTPEGIGPFERAAAAGQSARAEDIAAGQPDAAAVMEGWMNSAGHRANILNCDLTRLGVGVGYGGSYGITWTQLFG